MNQLKRFKYISIVQLLCLAFLFLFHSSNAAQAAAAYTKAYRYDLAGRVLGTILPDPDGSGALHFLATRNTYNATTGLLDTTESGELAAWASEQVAPAYWSNFTVYSAKIMEYDAYGRVRGEKIRDKNGALISYVQTSYDSKGHVACRAVRMNPSVYSTGVLTNPCAPGPEGGFGPDRISQYTYNGLDELLTETRAFGTSVVQTYVTNTYFPNSRRLQTQWDANGNKSSYYYDDEKRLRRVVYPSSTLISNQSASNPGNSNGTETGTSGDYVEFAYDANSNKSTERKRNGVVVTNTYDKLNRLVFKSYSTTAHQQNVSYAYDLRGLQLWSRFGGDSGQGVTHQYDGFGNLKYTSANLGGYTRNLNYQYDYDNNRTRITHPDNNYFIYTFDGLNRVSGVNESSGSNLLTVAYGGDGKRKSINRANGVNTNYTRANGIQINAYGHDFSGTANDYSNTFAYNPASQITRFEQVNSLYAYRGQDNRVGTYVPDGLNRYKTIAGQPMGYDLNNNLTNDGSKVYTYDDENRLISVSGSGLTASLSYYPDGHLFQTSINGQVRQYLFDGEALIAEYNGSNQLQERYVHGDQVDEPWVQYNGVSIGSGYRVYLHADYQSSIVAQSNGSGGLVATLAYDAYGIPETKNASAVGAFGYTGQIYLPSLGLDYYKARFYHPQIGRFLQTDPIGYKDDYNLYAYVGNDPVNGIDPSGMTGECSPSAKSCDTFTQSIPGMHNGGPNQSSVGEAAQQFVSGAQNGSGASGGYAFGGSRSPVPGMYVTSGGDFENVDSSLINEDGVGGYAFDYQTGTLVGPMDTGKTYNFCPDCYVLGTRVALAAVDIATAGYGITVGRMSFYYKLPSTQGRMIFKYGKFRLQYGKTWGGTLQPWYKRLYLKLPGKTNKHWPWD